MHKKTNLIIDTEEDSYDVSFEFSIQPSEPDVGITQPYVEEYFITKIKNGKENLHEDNWPFNNENIEELIEDLEEKLIGSAYDTAFAQYEDAVENGYKGKFKF